MLNTKFSLAIHAFNAASSVKAGSHAPGGKKAQRLQITKRCRSGEKADRSRERRRHAVPVSGEKSIDTTEISTRISGTAVKIAFSTGTIMEIAMDFASVGVVSESDHF